MAIKHSVMDFYCLCLSSDSSSSTPANRSCSGDLRIYFSFVSFLVRTTVQLSNQVFPYFLDCRELTLVF